MSFRAAGLRFGLSGIKQGLGVYSLPLAQAASVFSASQDLTHITWSFRK